MSSSESILANFLERENALVTGRAMSALYLLLKALSFEKAQILIPNNACYVIPLAIIQSGNVPVFCDISLEHYGLTVETLAQKLTPRTKAVVGIHMYGLPGDMAKIASWCRDRSLHFIEDAALALGGRFDGRSAGTLGDTAILSFGYGKIVDCAAGGVLLTDDSRLHKEAANLQQSLPLLSDDIFSQMEEFKNLYRLLRPLEKRRQNIHRVYKSFFDLYVDSYFFRLEDCWISKILDALQALDSQLEVRRTRSMIYEQNLNHPLLIKPHYPDGAVVWRYSFRCLRGRDALVDLLRQQGIPVSSWFPSVDRMFGRRHSEPPSPYPESDTAEAEIVNLWVDSSVSDRDVFRSIDAIRQWLDEKACGYAVTADSIG